MRLLKLVKATLLNAVNGQKIIEKEIPTNSSKFSEITLHKSDSGMLQYLVIRNTQWAGNVGFSVAKYGREARTTESLQLYSMNKDLAPKLVAMITPAADQQYQGSLTDSKGNLNILSVKGSNLQLEQYPSGATAAATVSTPFEWNDKWEFRLIMRENQGKIISALEYQRGDARVVKTAVFDVAQKKVVEYDEALGNEYRKLVEEGGEAPPGRDRDLQRKYIAEQELSDIHFYNQSIIVVKESRGITASATQRGRT